MKFIDTHYTFFVLVMDVNFVSVIGVDARYAVVKYNTPYGGFLACFQCAVASVHGGGREAVAGTLAVLSSFPDLVSRLRNVHPDTICSGN